MMRGKRENFFSREKKFSLSPRAPLSLSRKAGKLFLFTFTCQRREQSLLKNVPGHVKYASDRIGDKTQNGLFASVDAV